MAKTGVDPVRFSRGGLLWNIRVVPYDDISWYLFVDGGFQVAEVTGAARMGAALRRSLGSRNVC